LKKEGAREVVNSLRRMGKLVRLELFLRNIGLQKDEGKDFQNDLSHGKLGDAFITLDVHI